MVYVAAYAVANATPHRDREVSAAKAMASDAADRVCRLALQCHGAIGYTFEYDLHLWMKRAWALSTACGRCALPSRPRRGHVGHLERGRYFCASVLPSLFNEVRAAPRFASIAREGIAAEPARSRAGVVGAAEATGLHVFSSTIGEDGMRRF